MKRIRILNIGRGHYKIFADVNGQTQTAITTNTIAIDAYRTDPEDFEPGAYYETPEEAADALMNEIYTQNEIEK